MAFELPALPYAYSALEPFIDEETMHLHHDKHHATYVNNLNAALKEYSQFADLSIDQLIFRLDEVPESIRMTVSNNAGGHANHSLFWRSMSPSGGGEPSGELAHAIKDTFGSFDDFKIAFHDAGAKRFGSGWVWLVLDGNHTPQITSTANQESPMMVDQAPLLGNDVWEHAYYLKYQNRRPEYLSAWWNVVDWPEIAQRYEQAWP